MGNCLAHESDMMWGGEDWGEDDHNPSEYGKMTEKGMKDIEEKGLLRLVNGGEENINEEGDDGAKSSSSGNYYGNSNSNSTCIATTNGSTEVKIKITKKQLEGLLGKVDVKDHFSVQQVLAQLINGYQTQTQTHEEPLRPWRPALQSIPEVN